ncbi:hypothetical protein COCNU_12G001290 [Cocos nucifera]|uniref:Uncharacterized protein n=1 Tax=Cocos nucifera TaxID=13894 RepID=A0A8K0IQV6_COCNU|nr:hypothetical protein COCNU_12G001290 [Cocos nucifera]
MMQFLSPSIGGSLCGIGCPNIYMPSLRITQSTRAAAPVGLNVFLDDGLKKSKTANAPVQVGCQFIVLLNLSKCICA